LLANPALEQHTGLNGIVGKTAREIMPGHESHWIEAYSRVAATGEAIRRTDQAADLGRWFDVSAFPVGVGQVGVLFADVTARRAAEEELRASEARLSEIFRHAPSFMCVLSGPDHVFERVNDRYHQLVGHRDILGKPVLEAIPEVEGQGFVELLDGVYRTGDPFVGKDLPIRLQRVPGGPPEERYLDFVYQAVRDSDGQITGIFVQGIDLTDRKRAEEELRSKTERLNLLVENIKDYAVVIFDPEGLILEWQGGAERITGYAQDEAIGQRAGLLFTPQDLEIGLPQLEMSKAAETGRAEDKRWHLKKDGTRFYADGVMTALYTEDGKLRGFGKVFKDATADKLDEESTRRRAMKLQKLAGISLRISAAQDIDSVMSIVTEEARHLIGAHQSVTGFTVDANWTQAINHVSLSEKYADWQSYDASPDGSGIYSLVCRLNRPMRMTQAELEQHPAWKNFGGAPENHPPMRGWLAAPLTARDGGNLGLIQLSDKFEGEFTEEDEAILVQLAQLSSVAIANARLYQELRVNDEKKNEFLAMLAHELRNPLAAIANAVKLAATTSDQSHMDWSMGVITRQMIHLSRLIDDLMDVSRITRGKIELRRDVMDLTPILKSAAATVMTLVEERKHSLQLDIEGETLWADVDPTRLEQVVVNLLNNAAKYSDNAGHILLSARGEGSEIVVSIKDKGVGIPPDKLPEMFELFAQGDRSLARSEGGLGIGLTVVKKLVEMHGGIIVAKSDGPGKGSEFTIRLPAVAKPREGSSDPSSPEARKIKMARILVVDDNVDTARGMARLLKILGHEVATAHNGFEAIHLARSTSPDFILLDIGLPGMSGYEVAAQLRREECCRGAVIVAVSGYGQEEDRRRSKQAGFDFHLVKPLDHDALLALLAGSGRA
jgi:PAS domain S-box-containing protein